MNASRSLLTSAIAGAFALFLFGSTCSIALSQIMLGIALVLFIVAAIRDSYNPFSGELKPVYLTIAAFVLWEIIAALVGATPVRSLELMREEWLFAAIPIGIWVLQRPEYQRWCISALTAGVILIGIYGLIQHVTGVEWYKGKALAPARDYGYLVWGTFLQRMTFGNYYAMAGLFLIGYGVSRKSKQINIPSWLLIAAGALALIVTSLTFIRGAISAYIIGLILLGLLLGFRSGLRLILVVGAALLLLIMVKPALIGRFSNTVVEEQNEGNFMSRRFIWGNAIAIISEHPIFGLGPGNFKTEYVNRLPATAPDKAKHAHPHNDLLNEAAVSGLPGLALYLIMWIFILRFIWKKRADNPFAVAAIVASVTFFASSVTEATFVDEEVRQLLMAIWAFGLLAYFQPVSQGKTGRENNLTAPHIPA